MFTKSRVESASCSNLIAEYLQNKYVIIQNSAFVHDGHTGIRLFGYTSMR